MNNKTNKKLSVKVKTCSRSRYPYLRNRQGGALLLGLIITMVIFGALGGAMVYFISSSAMDSVFGNFAQRAYYAAESGMRYAAATYRKTNPPDDAIGRANFWALRGQTLSFPNNNGQAKLTITDSMPGVSADVETTAAENKTVYVVDSLLVTNATNFPNKNGFFRIGAGTVYYRYKTRLGSNGTTPTNQLQGVTGPGLSSSSGLTVNDGITKIIAPKGQYSITSVGYFPSASIGLFRRTVEYGWVLSGIPPGGPPPPPPVDLSTLPGAVQGGAMAFALAYPGGDEALNVTKDQGGAQTTEAYVLAPPPEPNPFWLNWVAWGGYSSYDLQVKIATGIPSDNTFTGKPTRYSDGLTFRAKESTSQNQFDFFGVSIMRSDDLTANDTDGIANGMIPPYTPPSGTTWTTWASGMFYNVNAIVQYTTNGYYYQCTTAHTSKASNPQQIIPTTSGYWTLLSNNDKPMIVLWRRDGNHGNGDDKWLAYKLLDQTGKDYIVDGSREIKDWSTLVVRVIEAASVKLNNNISTDPYASAINIGDPITGANGINVRVFRKINDNDGKVVLLLNKYNINDTFTLPGTIAGYNTDSNWGYRDRDNYIWVFYTDQDNHGLNDTPLETTDQYNTRYGQARSTITWPIYNVPAWTADVAVDKFSLVQWDAHLNTTVANTYTASRPSLYIMGTGKETGAIIRTDMWTRPGPYAASADYPREIGLAALGATSELTYFDDLAYRFLGYSEYGIEYVPYVQGQ